MAKTVREFQGGYRFLSNFYYASVKLNGAEYPTVEHAFQAAKSLDPLERMIVAAASTPSEAKKRGRKLELREDWEKVKRPIMRMLVRQKFTDHRLLREKLISTYPAILQEGNTWGDTYWGIDLRTGEGQNHLGRILMNVRRDLRWIHVV